MPAVLSESTKSQIEAMCTRYPSRLAALLPALHAVQKEHGHISDSAANEVAGLLGVAPTRVLEVISFYTMFYDAPQGRHIVKICRNLPCQLRGANKLIAHAEHLLGIKMGETTNDGRITLDHEECLASCGTAPMLWCNDTLMENLTPERLETFLASLP